MTGREFPPKANPSANSSSRYVFPIALIVAIVVHVLTVLYFAPPRMIFSQTPLANLSFELHVGQTSRVTRALDGFGESWAYEPKLLAGAPIGTAIDTNSRAWQFWTYSLWKMGLNKSTALNLFVLIAHLLAPWTVLLAARLFGLGKWPALAAAGLAYLLWFFDGYFHWCWWSGMVPFAVAGNLCLLCVALLYRYVSAPRWWLALLLWLAFAFTHLVHAYAVFALLVPFVLLSVLAFKSLGLKHFLVLAGAALVTLAVNAKWVALGFAFWSPGEGVVAVGQGTLSHLLTDFLGLNSDTSVTGGVGMRSGFRFLTLGAAVITLVLWRRDRDRRFRVIAATVLSLLGVAYLGGYIPGLKWIQPYRYVVPALFIATIPAAQLIEEVRMRGALRNLPKMAVVVGAMIVFAAIPRLARDVVYFVPAFVIEPKDLPEETPHIADIIGFGSIGYPRHRDHRHKSVPQYIEKIVKALHRWNFDQGRVLIEYEPLAEHVNWRTQAHVLGGSRFRNSKFAAANYFVRYPKVDPNPAEIRKYLETYAVGWAIVLANPDLGEDDYVERFAGQVDLLKPFSVAWPFRVLKSQLPVSYFQQGSGKVMASMNRFEVSDTHPEEDIVLRFHYLETLICEQDCKVEKHPVDGDPAGFVRVPAPHPSNFTITNSYRI